MNQGLKTVRLCLPTKRGAEEVVGDPHEDSSAQLFKKPRFTDFIITSAGEKYFLHKCVLDANCEYFHRLFGSAQGNSNEEAEWRDANHLELDFEFPVNKEEFETFLLFLYTKKIQREKLKANPMVYYDLADYFCLTSLKQEAMVHLKTYLTAENFEASLAWYQGKNCEEFDKTVIEYFLSQKNQLKMRSFDLSRLEERIKDRILFDSRLVFQTRTTLRKPQQQQQQRKLVLYEEDDDEEEI